MTALTGENYTVSLNKEANCVTFDGTLRLRGLDEYQEISLMLDAHFKTHNSITLDLKKLDFLNSSGIAMLSRFVINVRKTEHSSLTILGSNDVPWQGKSLKNLQRLMPELALEFDS